MNAIYGLYDPRVGIVRYVGMTTTPLEERLTAHVCEGNRLIEGKRKGTAVYRWIAKLLKENVRPHIRLLESCEDESLLGTLEVEWIANSRLIPGPKLLNGTKGGTGGRPTPETRAKQSFAQKEVWADPERSANRIANFRLNDPDVRAKAAASQPEAHVMSDPEGFRQMRSEVQKRNWTDPAYRENQMAKRPRGPRKTHCSNGHLFTEANTWVSPSTGWRRCRECDPHLASPSGTDHLA